MRCEVLAIPKLLSMYQADTLKNKVIINTHTCGYIHSCFSFELARIFVFPIVQPLMTTCTYRGIQYQIPARNSNVTVIAYDRDVYANRQQSAKVYRGLSYATAA